MRDIREIVNQWYEDTRWPWYKRFWRGRLYEIQYFIAIKLLRRIGITEGWMV